MVELTITKKNKVNLADYDYKQDIKNRLFLLECSPFDLVVLDEILFSSIKISIRKIAKNIESDESVLIPVLEKFNKIGLLTFEDHSVVIDKEARKYFETEIEKFEADFIPGMEFLQHLLKKIPIHVLPTWYSIPRTSDNIFSSLVEKYLLTPQIFQRHLLDLSLGNPILSEIAQDVFSSENLELSAQEITKKYHLSRELFEEYMLLLELNFVCCLKYQKNQEKWEERVTPFHEWREYLIFLRETTTSQIRDVSKIQKMRPHDFSFVEDLSLLLKMIKKETILLNEASHTLIASHLCPNSLKPFHEYLEQLVHKLQILKLAEVVEGRLYPLETASEWLEMRPESKALHLYRHPLNRLVRPDLPEDFITEKTLKEAEKSIQLVLDTGWVVFDDFFRGVTVPIGTNNTIVLKKCGKSWKYLIPQYTPEEKIVFHATIFERLFEAGVTAVGLYGDKACFTVTPFGRSLFG